MGEYKNEIAVEPSVLKYQLPCLLRVAVRAEVVIHKVLQQLNGCRCLKVF